jgi:hypothetical protein
MYSIYAGTVAPYTQRETRVNTRAIDPRYADIKRSGMIAARVDGDHRGR